MLEPSLNQTHPHNPDSSVDSCRPSLPPSPPCKDTSQEKRDPCGRFCVETSSVNTVPSSSHLQLSCQQHRSRDSKGHCPCQSQLFIRLCSKSQQAIVPAALILNPLAQYEEKETFPSGQKHHVRLCSCCVLFLVFPSHPFLTNPQNKLLHLFVVVLLRLTSMFVTN